LVSKLSDRSTFPLSSILTDSFRSPSNDHYWFTNIDLTVYLDTVWFVVIIACPTARFRLQSRSAGHWSSSCHGGTLRAWVVIQSARGLTNMSTRVFYSLHQLPLARRTILLTVLTFYYRAKQIWSAIYLVQCQSVDEITGKTSAKFRGYSSTRTSWGLSSDIVTMFDRWLGPHICHALLCSQGSQNECSNLCIGNNIKGNKKKISHLRVMLSFNQKCSVKLRMHQASLGNLQIRIKHERLDRERVFETRIDRQTDRQTDSTASDLRLGATCVHKVGLMESSAMLQWSKQRLTLNPILWRRRVH